MLNFCTLFDSNYSVKGLTMYYSLMKHCDKFTLYIFAFDDTNYGLLNRMELPNMVVIKLTEFEDEQLLSIKEKRSRAEYCWTSTPSVVLYCIEKYQLDHCTYIDADLYFYSNPKVLVDEMADNDVSIISHRYTPAYDQSKTSGKYCVQFMTFKNTTNGIEILKWWRNACIDWCYSVYEDGKFGDQMYLDDWTERFEGVCELTHLGGGMAPWNMQQYKIVKKEKNKIIGIDIRSDQRFELVFFHFHALYASRKSFVREYNFHGYSLPEDIKKELYIPYIKDLNQQDRFIRKYIKRFDGLATIIIENSWWKYLKVLRKRYLEHDNRYAYFIKI